jgi:hypothetical protein
MGRRCNCVQWMIGWRCEMWRRVGAIGLVIVSGGVAACGSTSGPGSAPPTQGLSARSEDTVVGATVARTNSTAGSGLDACLRKHGIAEFEAPATTAEARVGVGGVLGQGGMRVPRGATRPQFEAALKKCGLNGIQVQGAPITDPVFRHRILRLAVCLRRSGFRIPAPNMSGRGAVFDTRDIDIASARWRSAKRFCRHVG